MEAKNLSLKYEQEGGGGEVKGSNEAKWELPLDLGTDIMLEKPPYWKICAHSWHSKVQLLASYGFSS